MYTGERISWPPMFNAQPQPDISPDLYIDDPDTQQQLLEELGDLATAPQQGGGGGSPGGGDAPAEDMAPELLDSNGKPLPDGWLSAESQSTPGEVVYENGECS